MPKVGNLDVNLHTVGRDETIYARDNHTVSHTDLVAVRRTMPSSTSSPLRTNVRFERGFVVPGSGVGNGEKSVTVSIAATVPPGVDVALVREYVQEACTEAAALAANISTTGDIHLV